MGSVPDFERLIDVSRSDIQGDTPILERGIRCPPGNDEIMATGRNSSNRNLVLLNPRNCSLLLNIRSYKTIQKTFSDQNLTNGRHLRLCEMESNSCASSRRHYRRRQPDV